MLPHFEAIKLEAINKQDNYSSRSSMKDAYTYFLKYYNGLTVFIDNPDVPIDNNPSERLLRSHVIGRKTWLGTHSVEGAEAAVVLFSIVESCKITKVNPREFYLDAVYRIHHKLPLLTPKGFRDRDKPATSRKSIIHFTSDY